MTYAARIEENHLEVLVTVDKLLCQRPL
jgi:hypothetical protein